MTDLAMDYLGLDALLSAGEIAGRDTPRSSVTRHLGAHPGRHPRLPRPPTPGFTALIMGRAITGIPAFG